MVEVHAALVKALGDLKELSALRDIEARLDHVKMEVSVEAIEAVAKLASPLSVKKLVDMIDRIESIRNQPPRLGGGFDATRSSPPSIGGTLVTVTDALGTERQARIQFVSPEQLNFLMPPDTAPGPATVTVTNADGESASSVVQVAAVAPGIFSANASGLGPAAATFLTVEADGSRSEGLTFDSNAPLGNRTNIPIDLGPPGLQVYLSFFGTGFRFQSSASVQIGGVDVPLLGAVAQGQFEGLDQAVVGPLPPTLGGRGDVEAIFTFDGIQANAVTVNIR